MEQRHKDVLIATAAALVVCAIAQRNLYHQAIGVAVLHCAFGDQDELVRAFTLIAVFAQTSIHGPLLPAAIVLAWAAVCLVAAVMRCDKLAPLLLCACTCVPPNTGYAPVRLGVVAATRALSTDRVPLVLLLWIAYSPVELLPCVFLQLAELHKAARAKHPHATPAEDEMMLLPAQPAALARGPPGMVTLMSTKPLPPRGAARSTA